MPRYGVQGHPVAIDLSDPILLRNRPEDAESMLYWVAAQEFALDFRAFCQSAWNQVAPQRLVWNWHLDALCDHLVAMTRGEIRFLMVSLPPRHTKSLIASVLWPVWDWIHRPTTQFLSASVDDRLALDFSRLSRRVIESEWFQNLYGDRFYLLPDENAGRQFRNNLGGARNATSVQGRVTGSGGDCFPAGTMVSTPRGPVRIEALATNFSDVMSTDMQTRIPRRQTGFHERHWTGDLVEIVISDGRTLRCTPEHRIWIAGRGWVEAQNLKGQETLVSETEPELRSVRGAILPKPRARSPIEPVVLQRQVFWHRDPGSQQSIREMHRRFAALLFGVQGTDSANSETLRAAESKNLLACLSFGSEETASPSERSDFLRLRKGDFSPVGKAEQSEILLACMQRFRAFEKDRRNSKWAIRSWRSDDQAPAVYGFPAEKDQGKGRRALSFLRHYARTIRQGFGRASHQLFEMGSTPVELSDSVPVLSRHDARRKEVSRKLGSVLVVSTRRVPFSGSVYCIQVDEHRNFFANGIVVSNCQILDDAHDAKKVESDATRLASLQWHDNSWRSRLNSPLTAQKLYIGQRTHDSDIYGHVLAQEGKRWVNLCLPLEFDPKRICITYRNNGKGVAPDAPEFFRDPRKVEGELLDPKRFDADTAKAEKGIMSDRAWQAQYNQQPEGQGGLILKRHWWRQWVWPEWHPNAGQERPQPDFWEIIQVYDTAFEEDEEADFTARTTWGLFTYMEADKDKAGNVREGRQRTSAMLLDCLEERLSYPDLRAEAIDANVRHAPDWILIEKKASGHSLIQELKRKRLPIKAVGLAGSGGSRSRRQGDLIARAHESSLMLERGCIWAPPRNFAYKVIDHCAKFPAGDHDDITSTVCIALQYMRRYYDLTLPDDEKDETEINPYAWRQRDRAKRYA